jgi:hypothetical protein
LPFGYFTFNLAYNFRPRERETRRSRSKGVAAFFPDDVETFTYPVFERMQMNRKSEKSSNNQTHANGNQVSFVKMNINLLSIFLINIYKLFVLLSGYVSCIQLVNFKIINNFDYILL